MLASIMKREDMEVWKGFLNRLLSQMVKKEVLVDVLLFLFQQLDDQLGFLVNQGLSVCLQMIYHNQGDRLKLTKMLYYMIRSVSHLESTDKDMLYTQLDKHFHSLMVLASLITCRTSSWRCSSRRSESTSQSKSSESRPWRSSSAR